MKTEQPIFYLDNAATTFPKPEVVYQAMDHFYRNFGGNAGRGANPLARRAATLVDETRTLLKSWLNAPDIVFSPSATIALNTVLLGARLRPGDVVYVTPFEHNSVLRPLEHLRQTVGIEIQLIPFDRKTFECKLDELESLFRLEPPALVCVTQVSNVIGLAPPVDDILAMAKRIAPQAITIVDGAQAAGLRELDMSLVDALVFSGHKSMYGPYGIAGIAFGRDWRPEPLIFGGTGTQSERVEMPPNGPSRFESGSHNTNAVAGLRAAVQWLIDTGREAINTHTHQLTLKMRVALTELSGVTVYAANDAEHIGIVSFNVDGMTPQTVETALGANNIAVRAGLHCAPWTHEFIGTTQLGGAVRTSFGCFSTTEDVNTLVSYLAMLLTY